MCLLLKQILVFLHVWAVTYLAFSISVKCMLYIFGMRRLADLLSGSFDNSTILYLCMCTSIALVEDKDFHNECIHFQ